MVAAVAFLERQKQQKRRDSSCMSLPPPPLRSSNGENDRQLLALAAAAATNAKLLRPPCEGGVEPVEDKNSPCLRHLRQSHAAPRAAEPHMPASREGQKRKRPAAGPSVGNAGGSDARPRRRRRRMNKQMAAELYASLYHRIPRPIDRVSLAKQFSNQELRVLMRHNGMKIHDYDSNCSSYREKTKSAKCKILAAGAPTMIVPTPVVCRAHIPHPSELACSAPNGSDLPLARARPDMADLPPQLTIAAEQTAVEAAVPEREKQEADDGSMSAAVPLPAAQHQPTVIISRRRSQPATPKQPLGRVARTTASCQRCRRGPGFCRHRGDDGHLPRQVQTVQQSLLREKRQPPPPPPPPQPPPRRRKQQNTASVYRGVSWYKKLGKWQAQVMHEGRRFHIGYFGDEVEAARAYDTRACQLLADHAAVAAARLNFPRTGTGGQDDDDEVDPPPPANVEEKQVDVSGCSKDDAGEEGEEDGEGKEEEEEEREQAQAVAVDYSVGDLVSAFDRGQYHSARIIDIRERAGRNAGDNNSTHQITKEFLVHFQGWHRRYDAWRGIGQLKPLPEAGDGAAGITNDDDIFEVAQIIGKRRHRGVTQYRVRCEWDSRLCTCVALAAWPRSTGGPVCLSVCRSVYLPACLPACLCLWLTTVVPLNWQKRPA
eukprot:COSAG01_NODE_181_length_22873_cov_12.951392_2_plen_657_part_00